MQIIPTSSKELYRYAQIKNKKKSLLFSGKASDPYFTTQNTQMSLQRKEWLFEN